MLLNVLDRLLILNILPSEGNIVKLRVLRDMKRELGFSEEEHKALQFRSEADRTLWNGEADVPKEIPLGDVAVGMITDALRGLESKGKLGEDYVDLYDKFFPAGKGG